MSALFVRTKNECKLNFNKNYSLNIIDEWLDQCIEYVLEENQNLQTNDFASIVNQQLLDFNLNEIGSTCTSKQLAIDSNDACLEGNFLFQINLCIDVTESYYSKLLKLTGGENDNAYVDADVVPTATQFENRNMKKSRVLTLFLTDGSVSFKAIEYKSIPCLNEDILPGVKVQLRGRMPYRNKVLFLGPENVKILGGKVENFSLPNNLIEILKAELEAKRNDQRSVNQREKSCRFEATYPKSNQSQKPISIKNEQPKTSQTTQNINTQKKTVSKFKQLYDDDDEDDEMLANCDFVEIEKNACSPAVRNNNNNTKTNNIKRHQSVDLIADMHDTGKKHKTEQHVVSVDSEDDEDIYLMQNIVDITGKVNNKNNNVPQQSNKAIVKPLIQKPTVVQKKITIDDDDDDDDDFNQFLEKGIMISEKTDLNETFKDLIDISKLESCCFKNVDASSTLSTCAHIKKGSFKTLIGKILQTKLKWYQDCLITDGKIDMEVYIGDGPLTDFLELTCEQAKCLFKSAMEELKESGYSKSRDLFETHRKNCELKLQNVKSCLMHLKYDFAKKKFCIIKIEMVKY